jgi:hypothetical protein
LTTAPTIPAATSPARSTPSPKCAESASPLVTTEIASAVESVPDGDLSFVRPSAVAPERSSRNTVTTRRISSPASGSRGSSSAAPSSATRRATISTSACSSAGSGRTTVLNRRRSAADRSLTPRSRSFAVAMTLKPLTACTSMPSSDTGSVFSDRIVISASWTSDGMRVSSSTRAMRPSRIAVITGDGTIAAGVGPSASSFA